MAQIITKISQSKVINSLDTYNHTAGTSNMYKVSMDISEVPPSGISIAIQQNGVTKATSVVPSAAQNAIYMQTVLNCVASDLISVIVSSSSAAETGINIFKGILNIHTGSM